MSVLIRRPPLRCWVDGQQLSRVISARVARSLDQEYATGEVILAWPPPGWLKQWQWVVLSMGGTPATAYDRLVGYLLGFTYELWPTAVTLHLGDPLALCARFWPSDVIDLTGMDDAQIVRAVLNEVGFPASLIGDIAGTGRVVSETALTWPLEESAMDLIKEVDGMSSGFRTFAGLDGVIHRRWFDTLPSSSSAFDLTEGVDVLTGSVEFQLVEPKNQVTVRGDADIEAVATGPFVSAFRTTPAAPVNYPLVQYQDADAAHVNATDIASWLLGQLNRNIIRTSLSTFRDDRFGMGSTVWVESEHVAMTGYHWLQGVTTELTEQGAFTQQLELISELSLDEDAAAPGLVDPTGVGMPEIEAVPPTETTVPSGISPGPTAGMTIAAIDQERVVISGTETTVYSLTAIDASTPLDAPITAWDWAASGPGVSITSGSEETFSTSFTDLTGASIALTVTDANGATGTLTRDLSGGAGIPIRKRKLYAATATDWAVFDGDTWRTDAPGGAMLAVAHGPAASAGADALLTADDLATPASHSSPFGSVDVTAVWMEEDNSPGFVAAGSDDGQVALSDDGGATWTVKPGPGGGTIRRIVRSRFDPSQVWAIVASFGIYLSNDGGDTFSLLRDGDFVDLLLSHSRNVVLGADGSMERAEPPGDPFTFPGSPTIVSMAPGIRSDIFFAFGDDGTTYVSGEGDFAMTARASVPAGAPQIRGADADGDLIDLLYVATDSNLYKSIDALRSAEGYLTLREGAHTLILHGKYAEGGPSGGGIFVGTFSGLFVYDPSGDSWSDHTPSPGDDNIVALAASGQEVWAATDSPALYHSSDGGVTWAPAAYPGSGGSIDRLKVAGSLVILSRNDCASSADNGLYTGAVDGTGGWTQVHAPGAPFVWNGDIVGSVLYFAINAGTIRHFHTKAPAALGGTDTDLSQTAAAGTQVAIRGEPSDSTTAYFCSGFDFGGGMVHVWKVVGTTISDITPSGTPSSGGGFVDVASNGSGTLLALWNDGSANTIYRSTDGGSSWTDVHTATGAVNGWPAIVWQSASSATVAFGGGVARSSDGGATWTDSAAAPATPNVLAAG